MLSNLKRPDAETEAEGKRRAEEREQRVVEARKMEAVAALAAKLGTRYSPALASLEAFECKTAAQKEVVARLKKIGGSLGEFLDAGRGILLFGTIGTGKDHLAAAMLYQATRLGFLCSWVGGQELFGRFRDAMGTGEKEDRILTEYAKPKVLCISDPIPPAAAPSAYNLQQLYRLVDRRYREMKSTWATFNALTLKEADSKFSSPVFDRLRDGAELIVCKWPSRRER